MFKSKKKLIIVIVSLLAGLNVSGSTTETQPPKTYGSVIVDKVLNVNDGFTIRCDIKQWPPVIGRNIPVRINAVQAPSNPAGNDETIKKLNSETRSFIQTTLAKAKVIILRNIKRGRTFCLVADVVVDSNSLADLLIQKGLAKRMVGTDIPEEKIPGTISSVAPGDSAEENQTAEPQTEALYIASKNSRVFHYHTCRSAKTISPENIVKFDSRDQSLQTGRRPCRICKP